MLFPPFQAALAKRRCSYAFLACAFFTLAIGPSGIRGQSAIDPSTTQKLDEEATSFTGDDAFMGTVLVSQNGSTLLNKGYGKADVGWNIPNEPDVRFRIGSLTKQFTAALILLEQQDGKLSVNDPVRKCLPESPAAWQGVTIADLLHHTSGIPNFIFDPRYLEWKMVSHSPQEVVNFFKDKPLNFAPGSQFEYSNSNYTLLGVLLERVSGRHYGDLLRDRILVPLAMDNTGLDDDSLIVMKHAKGYQPGPKMIEPARSSSLSVGWAAGAMYSTTGDLLRWEQGLLGGRLLSPASLKQMTTPAKANYADGLFVNQRDGLEVVEHGGSIEGFNTYMISLPARSLVVIVLSNVSGDAPDRMSRALVDVVLGKPVTLFHQRSVLPISQKELSQYTGTFDLSAQLSFTITEAEGGLLVQATGQPPMTFLYEGEVAGHPQFFTRAMDAQLEYVLRAKQQPLLVVHLSGTTMPAGRR